MSDALDDQLRALDSGRVPPLAPASLIRRRGEPHRLRTRIASGAAGLVLILGAVGTALALTGGGDTDAVQFATPGPTASCAPANCPGAEPGPLAADDRLRLDGIGPIVFGMTLAEAERAAGQPFTPFVDDLGNGCGFVSTRSNSPDLSLMVRNGKVVRVDVMRASSTVTDRGIGIGSTEQQVKQAYGSGVVVSKHDFTQGNYLRVTSDDGRNATVFETDGQVVGLLRAGTNDAAGYNEGCA